MDLFTIACAGLALRSIISLHAYSGQGVAPMFGDYEAQRHWQEVTINLDTTQWYTNGTDNDLLYWGLDYPPLTAYHSYVMGKIGNRIDSQFVELHTSRGIENEKHKTFMRLTVLVGDILIYIPATLILCLAIDRYFKTEIKLALFTVFMLYPGQVLIDNGHFQYNNISLGLAAIAIAAILYDKHGLAAFAFTLALNYKQMELYHALPFFVYLLGECLTQQRFSGVALKFMKIAAIVLITFAVLWFPWLRSLNDTLQVLHRLFPVARGVFEDKVANVWCAVNVVFKLKRHFTNQQMAVICLVTTMAAAIPTNVLLMIKRNKIAFLLTLFNTAAAFFLFSFQVHEKTILLVALPASCLFSRWPREMFWFLEITVFSMIPLLTKDKLLLPTGAMMILLHLVVTKFLAEHKRSTVAIAQCTSELTMLAIAVANVVITPPARLPDLWPLIISVFSCIHFTLFLLWGYFQQFTLFKLTKASHKQL